MTARVILFQGAGGLGRKVALGLGGTFDVLAFRDVTEAAEAAAASGPDAIVAVVARGRPAGEELLHRIRALPALDGVPFLGITSADDPESRVRLLRHGAQDFIVRPFLMEELQARLQDLVDQKRARQVLSAEVEAGDQSLDRLALAAAQRRRVLQGALNTLGLERDAATRASETKTRLLRSVVHDLRTPMHVLRMHLELLQARVDSIPEGAKRSVRGAMAALGELTDLVENVLSGARTESVGGRRTDPAAVDLREVVREAVSGLRILARGKGLRLTLRVARRLPPVVTDPRLVQRIVVNLVDNAIKYTAQGEVRVSMRRCGGALILRVDDTGMGIPEEFLDRIFAPFERLPSDDPRGAGLGLTLVKEMAGRLGGDVRVRSVPGEGSSFRFILPLGRRVRRHGMPPGPQGASRSSGRRR